MNKLLKKLLKYLLTLIILFFLLSVLIVALVDINQYKNEISQFVKDETGLSVEINGELYLNVLSGIKVKASDIKISHNTILIAHIDHLILETTRASLYKEKPAISSLELVIKKLDLTRDKKGQYQFLAKQGMNKNEKIDPSELSQYRLENLSIKNVQLSIGQFLYQDKSNALSIKLESLKASLSNLRIIDHYELVLDDPRVLVNYSYSGNLSAKKASANQYETSDLSLALDAQKGNFIVTQLMLRFIQYNRGKNVKKLDFSGKGKLRLFIHYAAPKGFSEPLWSQPESIKMAQIDFNLPDFLLSEKQYQLELKKSHLVMDELAVFENSQFSLKNLLLKSLAFNSDQIDVSPHAKDKYHLKKVVLQINNLPVMDNNKLFDPLSHQFLTKFSQHGEINLSINSVVEKEQYGITNVNINLQGKDKKISLSRLSFNAIDSKINAEGELSLQKKTPSWALKVHSDKLNLKPISELLNTPTETEGYISINSELSGTMENSDFKFNDGRVHVKGTNIIMHGIELDKVLNDFERSQRISLLDVGTVALLGPAGIALSKGNDYTTLMTGLGKGGKSTIAQLNSDISFSNGISSMDDVSFITGRHQLVIKGKINMQDETFMDFQAATVDKYGCPIYKEKVKGSLTSPTIEKVNILVHGIVNPVKSIQSKLTGPIKSHCKKPFYNGVLKQY